MQFVPLASFPLLLGNLHGEIGWFGMKHELLVSYIYFSSYLSSYTSLQKGIVIFISLIGM